MPIPIPMVDAISGLFTGLFGLVDNLHTSEEERLNAKGKIFAAQAALLTQVFDYEKTQIQAQASIVTAEAQGESWIQRSWRPLTMLTFVGLITARWLGWTAPNLTPELESQLMVLVQIGLGGYVVGRSAEKVAKSINFSKTIEEKE